MSRLIGMAGLAEAAMAESLAIGMLGLLLLAIVAAVAWFRRSFGAATVAVVLVPLLGLLFVPWRAFGPVESEDADVHFWVSAFRQYAVLWGIVAAAALASAFRAFRAVWDEASS